MGIFDTITGGYERAPKRNTYRVNGNVVFVDSINNYKLNFSDEDLSRHLLMLGEHGSGKTNVVKLLINQLDADHNKVLIFDPKGDYRKEFFRPNKDILISANVKDRNKMRYWNMFREIEFSSIYMMEKKESLKEMVASFFKGKENQTQPFFSDGARDMFSMIIENQLRLLWDNEVYKKAQDIIEGSNDVVQIDNALKMQRDLFESLVDTELNNSRLAKIMKSGSLTFYRHLLGGKFKRVYAYLGDSGNYNTGLSVIGEMQSVYSHLFEYTMFEQYVPKKDFAICEFINNGTGRMFLEYSISAAEALTPIYSVLCDMAMKIQLTNYNSCRNKLYMVWDELKLAPSMIHFQDALNLGRSLGIRIVAGIQSIEQLKDAYGEYTANVLMESFSTIFSFQLTGAFGSRKYVVNRIGQCGSFSSRKASFNELNSVDERSILQLKCGQCICKKYGDLYPILFSFEEYHRPEYDEHNISDMVGNFIERL